VTDLQARRLLSRSVAFLDLFAGCVGRPPRRDACRKYIRGLLSDHPRKSMQPIAGALTSTAGYQTLQHFITHARWNEQEVWKHLRRAVPAGPGVYLIDDTGFPKQGRHSVGVSRQYSGTLGRVGSCQVGVGAVFAQKQRVWPMGLDLYLPREWAENLPRRESVEVPTSVEFLEKWRISLSQLDRARRDGSLIDAVVADAGSGEIFEFRQSLRKRQLR